MTDLIATLQAAAGNAAGEGLYVEEVFSTYLYTGTGSNQTITNGVDLDGEGGLVWVKGRNFSSPHILVDTDRGVNNNLRSHQTIAEYTQDTVTAFNSTGFTVTGANGDVGSSGNDYASWTFRKAPKFFDVVTWTGDGTSGKTVSHSLGSVPGSVVIKRTDSTSNWTFWHRSLTAEKFLRLNLTDAEVSAAFFEAVSGQGNVDPTDSVITLGNSSQVNASGGTYVAYLFAHNDGDGEFGEDADQDIIKCGSYTGTGAAGNFVDLGFEPQWVMIKRTNASADWFILDIMRGASASSYAFLEPNLSDSETVGGSSVVEPKATGFNLNNTGTNHNGSGSTYIYIAIRRGPMKTPESGTEVFDAVAYTGNNVSGRNINTGFVTDSVLGGPRSSDVTHILDARLTGGRYLATQTTSGDSPGFTGYDTQNGYLLNNTAGSGWNNSSYTYIRWAFRRAPGFFDVVAYEGTGSATTVSHNLGVAPELMIVKRRDSASSWYVYDSETAVTNTMFLEQSTASADNAAYFGDTEPTASVFSVDSAANTSGADYIAYLFATLPGISKVGSYTGNGSTQTIDCGFSAGARFVMIKVTDGGGDWNVWDSERGIVAGNDPKLELNTTDAEITGEDFIDPDSSGFSLFNKADTNANGQEYIFLAIA